ncbi:MAG: arsenate reductase family protein [Clostridia bacterium]|nr:arsenate reductase family protein [Clostridia bacterium]
MIKFICYPKCSTCKKAQSYLDENSIEYEIRNIKTDNPSYDELKEWYEMSELPLKTFFNTSGILYRSMGLKDKLGSMSEEEQFKLLATDGMLVKRPIAVSENTVLVGFNADKWSALK